MKFLNQSKIFHISLLNLCCVVFASDANLTTHPQEGTNQALTKQVTTPDLNNHRSTNTKPNIATRAMPSLNDTPKPIATQSDQSITTNINVSSNRELSPPPSKPSLQPVRTNKVPASPTIQGHKQIDDTHEGASPNQGTQATAAPSTKQHLAKNDEKAINKPMLDPDESQSANSAHTSLQAPNSESQAVAKPPISEMTTSITATQITTNSSPELMTESSAATKPSSINSSNFKENQQSIPASTQVPADNVADQQKATSAENNMPVTTAQSGTDTVTPKRQIIDNATLSDVSPWEQFLINTISIIRYTQINIEAYFSVLISKQGIPLLIITFGILLLNIVIWFAYVSFKKDQANKIKNLMKDKNGGNHPSDKPAPLSLAYAEESSGDFDVFATSEGVPIKLDLAQAYVNMGDIDSAKLVLKDIINQHRGKIVAAAQELLKKIT